MHDVFISHSSKDKAYADSLCAKLESEGIQCWIAPRNIMPGMEWGAAIIDAIESSRLMVLLLTESADTSPQIVREVERAVSKGLRIVPLRVEDIKPGKNLEYFLGTPHWLDALPPPFENHLDRIVETVKALLENRVQTGALTTAATTQIRVPAGGSLSTRNQAIGIGALAILVLVVVFFGWRFLSREEHPVAAAMVGMWTASNALGPDNMRFTLKLESDGSYQYGVAYEEPGRVVIRDSQVFFETADGNQRPLGALAPGVDPPTPVNLIQAVPTAFWTLAQRWSDTAPSVPAGDTFAIVQRAAIVGIKAQPAIWEWNHNFGKFSWRLSFQFDQSGGYLFSGRSVDSGQFEAREGKWRADSKVLGASRNGSYSLAGPNSMVLSGTIRGAVVTTALGQTLWDRSQATPFWMITPSPALAPPVQIASIQSASATPAPTASPTAAVSTQAIKPLDKRFMISRDSRAYADPSTDAKVVARLKRGKWVHVTGFLKDWLRIEMNDGSTAFIPMSSVE